MDAYDDSLLWIVILGFVVSFILSLGVGANDVANSFGTSVGAKVLSLRTACILATIFEVAGAVLIGYKVSDTIRKGILDVSLFNGSEPELMTGSLSALCGSAVWQLIATYLKLPVSGTHSIVGATLGFTLVAHGLEGVRWKTMGKIVGSWFVSPLMSGVLSVSIFFMVYYGVLKRSNAVQIGLRILPLIYAITVFINVFSVVHNGPSLLYLDKIPWWGALLISAGFGILCLIVVQIFFIPYLKKQVETDPEEHQRLPGYTVEAGPNEVKFTFEDSAENSRSASPHKSISLEDLTIEMEKQQNGNHLAPPGKANGFLSKKTGNKTIPTVASSVSIGTTKSNAPLLAQEKSGEGLNGAAGDCHDGNHLNIDGEKPSAPVEKDHPQVGKLFSFLQILTAVFGSFAHGGNDVSNAIGPLVAIWLIFIDGNVQQKSESPVWLLFYGGIGISIGLWIWGRRVIETIGQDLTKVTPSSGFTIEIGSALTVLLASKIGLPVSTTHCKVGSVVFVGWARSDSKGVDWKLFRNIVLAWLVTVPVTAALSAAIMAIMKFGILPLMD